MMQPVKRLTVRCIIRIPLFLSVMSCPVFLSAQAAVTPPDPKCAIPPPKAPPIPHHRAGGGLPSEENDALRKANGANLGVFVVTIKLNPDKPAERYTAYAGAGVPLYSGDSLQQLAETLNAHKPADTRALYVHTDKFSSARKAALETSLRIQFGQLDESPRILSDHPLPESLFASGAAINQVSAPELASDGVKKGWYKVVVQFSVRIGNMLAKPVLTLFVRSIDLANALYAQLTAKLHASPLDQSVASLVVDMRQTLKKTRPELSDDDLAAEFVDQFGNNTLVLLSISQDLIVG
jgi:hypothetical protein